jgi:hypothetical protein
MRTSTFSTLFAEVGSATSPQLPYSDEFASAPRPASAPGARALFNALLAELLASEARAQRAEARLAAHGRHCICRAAEIAAEDAEAVAA